MAVSANKLELIQIADAVAREKLIDKNIVIEAMADAIQKAAKSRYGQETDIRADINAQTGEIRLRRILTVVEEVENPDAEITLRDGQARDAGADIGTEFEDP
ncbi:MAG: NusA N-terminal domain-containing protein, partial [Pseudomonadota bacterium]